MESALSHREPGDGGQGPPDGEAPSVAGKDPVRTQVQGGPETGTAGMGP